MAREQKPESYTLKIEVDHRLHNWLVRSEYAQFIGVSPEDRARFILITEIAKLIEGNKDGVWRSFPVFQLIDNAIR